jgi:ADP-ribose pyrophosphatase YjhB (NUDIX family)
MKQLAIINPEDVSDKDVKKYSTRTAARAVVFDENNLIALLNVSNEKYYKLPGGGVENLEDFNKAVKRECQEEIGSDIDIISEIGSIVEYRKIFNLKQTSYCYLAKIKGEKGNTVFTEEEIQKGFGPVWLPYNEALKVLSNNVATSFEGKNYIVPRDIIFLKEAKEYFDSLSKLTNTLHS